MVSIILFSNVIPGFKYAKLFLINREEQYSKWVKLWIDVNID
jgi:hypothetical protein